MSKLTPYGKAIRKLRIDRGILLYDMAKALDVTSTYLCGVEFGRNKANLDLVNKASSLFGLDKDAAKELHILANLSNTLIWNSLASTLPSGTAFNLL